MACAPPQEAGEAVHVLYWHQITRHLGAADYPVVFTHGDIAARNIIVRDGHVAALLDWEYAGWMPEYWEYAFALRGMENVAWQTLGCEVPWLFGTRFDLEYILMGYIMSIS